MSLAEGRSPTDRLKRWLFRRTGRRRPGQQDPSGWDRRLIQSLSSARLPTWRQIRHLPEVMSSHDGWRLRLGVLLLLGGLGLLGARFYYKNTVIAPAVGGTIVEGVVGTPRSLNPILAPSNDVDADLTRLTFSRLFTTDEAGKIVPELVASFSISDDRRAYTLALRDDVRWHDGKPLTAADVAFTLGLIQDPAWKSPLYGSFKDVSVEQPDDRTVVLTLKEPYAPFLSRLTFGILPRHAWKDVSPQDAPLSELNLKPVGSGPFRFGSLKRDKRGFVQSYTLERNPDYFKGPPYIEELTFQFYPDYPAALDALRKRQIGSLSFVPRDARSEVRGFSNVLPVSLELPQYTAVFFNQKKNELLKDRAVRKALIMAIDKPRILFDVLGGDAHPIEGPPLPGYAPASNTVIAFKLDEAAALLEEAGWKTDPEDGIRKKAPAAEPKAKTPAEPVPLRVTLTTVDQPESLAVAKIIKSGWAAIGVDAAIQAIPSSDIHRLAVKPREYEALLYGQLLGADPDPYPFWHSTQVQDPGLNLALFSDREADDAIEAAQRAPDVAARVGQYRKFQQVLADQLPAAFLYSPSYTYALPAEVKGFSGTRVAGPSDRFASVPSWYLETRRVWKK